MNIRRVKQHRTVLYPVYGRVPIKDALKDVDVKVEERHIKDGKQNNPEACAIALAIRSNAALFPGDFRSASVFKTYTLLATLIRERIQVQRYVHPQLRAAINGFDAPEKGGRILKAGDTVRLLAPTSSRRLGIANGTSHSGSTVPNSKRQVSECRKRAIFKYRQDALLAAQEMADTMDQVTGV